MEPIEEPDLDKRIRHLVWAANPARLQPIPPPEATAADLRARPRLHPRSFRGRGRDVAGMRVDIGSGGPPTSGPDRASGALRQLYALVCAPVGAAAIDSVGNLAAHLLSRRTTVGAFAQILLAAAAVVVAGVRADRVLARIRHDWAALLASRRWSRTDPKGRRVR
jgi:hypothetical protein